MYETPRAKTRALRLRRSALRQARAVLAAAVVAAAFLVPPVVAGLLTLPAHAATTTPPPIVVDSTFDFADTNPGDGFCDFSAGSDQPCSLRAAIQEANARPGLDAIAFSVRDALLDPSTGVATITPESPLPAITEQVTINGYTQQGAHPNTRTVGDDAALKVELDGTKAPGGSGLEISGSSGSVIRGLAINRFNAGIDVHGVSSVGNRIGAG
jgi:CSLREA domain-containing protein